MSSEWERGIDENPLYASSMGRLDKNDEWPVYTLEFTRLDSVLGFAWRILNLGFACPVYTY